MSDIVIRADKLGKKYRIEHRQERQRYVALRDVFANKISSSWRRINRWNVGPQSAGSKLGAAEDFWALKDVSFDIKQGEVVGIIGRNGAGKSTLLKILSRITEPTKGRVRIRGRVASLLEVGTGFHPELTGRENIYLNGAILGMTRSEIARKFDEIVAFAEVEQFLDTPVKRYSSGMYVRLAFAVAAHLEPEILVVDEVLAVGDAEFQKKCLGRMGEVAKEGRTVLFVSHNLAAVERLCTVGMLLNRGQVEACASMSEVIRHYLLASQANEVVFDNEIVKRAYVRQLADGIEIFAQYESDKELDVPCLGFVISDYLGNPICGTNPVVDGLTGMPTPSTSGDIKIHIKYPKLTNGTYRLSLWFGDGKDELFIKKDCLIFDVVNMGNLRQLPASTVGPVLPVCVWHFSEDYSGMRGARRQGIA